ncbi:hypothetical protein PSQ19_01765 [Devosia algicola]|uniref:Uncharacterized protein n=1 Tax=Devosia algicola TaxID=3026418 RepID=A0ABY7YQ03_9HYPH|nr:hypothetical protein [Devosia algicola]WDR02970.1 hypothetical protein PSQ19_01765 [Devosia algicola]
MSRSDTRRSSLWSKCTVGLDHQADRRIGEELPTFDQFVETDLIPTIVNQDETNKFPTLCVTRTLLSKDYMESREVALDFVMQPLERGTLRGQQKDLGGSFLSHSRTRRIPEVRI